MLTLGFSRLPQLSLPRIQDPSIHASAGLSPLKESVIHSIHPLRSETSKLSQNPISILFQIVRIPLQLCLILFFCSAVPLQVPSVLLIPRALLNKPWQQQPDGNPHLKSTHQPLSTPRVAKADANLDQESSAPRLSIFECSWLSFWTAIKEAG